MSGWLTVSAVPLLAAVGFTINVDAAAARGGNPRKACPPIGTHDLTDSDQDGRPDVYVACHGCVWSQWKLGHRKGLTLRSYLCAWCVGLRSHDWSRCDNCPLVSNYFQHDVDKDHVGDVRELEGEYYRWVIATRTIERRTTMVALDEQSVSRASRLCVLTPISLLGL